MLLAVGTTLTQVKIRLSEIGLDLIRDQAKAPLEKEQNI
jgi:hypothetical protein